jgi:hypothetical protein
MPLPKEPKLDEFEPTLHAPSKICRLFAHRAPSGLM